MDEETYLTVLLCLSIHIKDDKIRTLEDQLREELAQISNTKEEFKVSYRIAILVLIYSKFPRLQRLQNSSYNCMLICKIELTFGC